MLILVANLGSTSFKFKLFEMPSEKMLATGSASRIGEERRSSLSLHTTTPFGAIELDGGLLTHQDAIDASLLNLVHMKVLKSEADIGAIGFKAVHGGPICEAVRVTDLLERMHDGRKVVLHERVGFVREEPAHDQNTRLADSGDAKVHALIDRTDREPPRPLGDQGALAQRADPGDGTCRAGIARR